MVSYKWAASCNTLVLLTLPTTVISKLSGGSGLNRAGKGEVVPGTQTKRDEHKPSPPQLAAAVETRTIVRNPSGPRLTSKKKPCEVFTSGRSFVEQLIVINAIIFGHSKFYFFVYSLCNLFVQFSYHSCAGCLPSLVCSSTECVCGCLQRRVIELTNRANWQQQRIRF